MVKIEKKGDSPGQIVSQISCKVRVPKEPFLASYPEPCDTTSWVCGKNVINEYYVLVQMGALHENSPLHSR